MYTTTRERSPRGTVGEMHVFQKHCSRLNPKSCILRHYLNTWSATCHNKPRKLHGFGGAEETGNRTWDLLHLRADPHRLSYTCNFPLVLFLFPLLSPSCPLGKCCGQGPLAIERNPLLQKETPYYRKESLTTEGNPLL